MHTAYQTHGARTLRCSRRAHASSCLLAASSRRPRAPQLACRRGWPPPPVRLCDIHVGGERAARDPDLRRRAAQRLGRVPCAAVGAARPAASTQPERAARRRGGSARRRRARRLVAAWYATQWRATQWRATRWRWSCDREGQRRSTHAADARPVGRAPATGAAACAAASSADGVAVRAVCCRGRRAGRRSGPARAACGA
eukprot:7216686-Prymnesium_polylepis.1